LYCGDWILYVGLCPEDELSTVLRNVGIQPPHYTALQARKPRIILFSVYLAHKINYFLNPDASMKSLQTQPFCFIREGLIFTRSASSWIGMSIPVADLSGECQGTHWSLSSTETKILLTFVKKQAMVLC